MTRTPDDIVSSRIFQKTKHAFDDFSKQFRGIAENFGIQTQPPEYEIIPNRKQNPWYKLRIHPKTGDALLAIDAQFSDELDAIDLLQIYVDDLQKEDAASFLKQHTINYFEGHADIPIDQILIN